MVRVECFGDQWISVGCFGFLNDRTAFLCPGGTARWVLREVRGTLLSVGMAGIHTKDVPAGWLGALLLLALQLQQWLTKQLGVTYKRRLCMQGI
jgi:hypothetical protein